MSNTVRDVMTTPVVTVRPDTPFKHLIARVRAVGAVPVTDDAGLVLGIVGERDLLAKSAFLKRSPGCWPRRVDTASAAGQESARRPA